MTRIAIVEDNENLALGIRTRLELEGYEVLVAEDGVAGLRLVREQRPDLVVLDLMLPALDGYGVLSALRGEGDHVPVVILTARADEVDKVLGFRLGADDYVTKPFGLLELMARIEAVLRRAQPQELPSRTAEVFRFGDVEVNFAARTVRREGSEVQIRPRSFDLLAALIRREGVVLSRQELLQEVWGHRAAVVTRTVDIHIAELRGKLECDPTEPRHIVTVWKAGYRFERG